MQLEEITATLGEVLREVEVFTREEWYGFAFTKVVLRLADGSSLRIWEKYRSTSFHSQKHFIEGVQRSS